MIKNEEKLLNQITTYIIRCHGEGMSFEQIENKLDSIISKVKGTLKNASKKICCLCGEEIEGYGNNPYPLDSPEKKCCDKCNEKVILARMGKLTNEN